MNALGAVAAARLLGIGGDAIRAGLEAVDGRPGPVRGGRRGAAVHGDRRLLPHAGRARATCSAQHVSSATGRVICVFGCGGDRDRGKRPLMGRVATEQADLAIVTSDNPRSEDPGEIIAEIVAGAVGEVVVEPDRRAAIERAVEAAAPGDVVARRRQGARAGPGDRRHACCRSTTGRSRATR